MILDDGLDDDDLTELHSISFRSISRCSVSIFNGDNDIASVVRQNLIKHQFMCKSFAIIWKCCESDFFHPLNKKSAADFVICFFFWLLACHQEAVDLISSFHIEIDKRLFIARGSFFFSFPIYLVHCPCCCCVFWLSCRPENSCVARSERR